MVIKVNEDRCIGCGACISICPKGFRYNDRGKSEPISQEILDCTKEARDSCPVEAITVED